MNMNKLSIKPPHKAKPIERQKFHSAEIRWFQKIRGWGGDLEKKIQNKYHTIRKITRRRDNGRKADVEKERENKRKSAKEREKVFFIYGLSQNVPQICTASA